MPDLIVSNSEIQDFKLCRRRWYLRYVRGLRPPEKATGHLGLGTNVHEALGLYYSPGGSVHAALTLLESIYVEKFKEFPNDHEKLNKEFRLANTMVEGYFQWVEEEGIDSGLQVVESEVEIETSIVLPSGIRAVLLGKRDLIGMDEHERRFFLDFKTCQTLGDNLLDINEQLLTYALLEKLKNPESNVQYAIWRMLRKTLRTDRAKPPFYANEQIELSDRLLRNFYLRLVGTLEDMARVKADLADGAEHRTACYPTTNPKCSWGCDYRVVCPMLDRDAHAEEFLSDQFEQHDPYSRYTSEIKGTLE